MTSAGIGHAGMMETAPGRPDTNRPTANIASMPHPMTRSGQPSSPNGIKNTDRAAAGMVTNPMTGIASRLPITA